jgi:hypothetical protein
MRLFLCCAFCILFTFDLFAQNEARLTYFLDDEPKSTPTLFDTSVLYISSVDGFKPDFERICQINIAYSNGLWIATCTNRPFTIADIGKILVVKNARNYLQYRRAPFTLNAIINTVGINGIATITSFDRNGTIKSVTGECGFVATDNFDALQRAIDTCAYRNKRILDMRYEGTAYVVPERTNRPRPAANQPALIVSTNLMVRGIGSNITKLKWGMEDINQINDVDNSAYYVGFFIKNCTFILKNMTLESADRGSTYNDHQRIAAINGDPNNRTGQNIIIDSCKIVSTDSSGFYGWGNVIYKNGGITLSTNDTSILSVTNSTITGQGGISFFSRNPEIAPFNSADTLKHLLRIKNSVLRGGATYSHKANGASIRIGSDTVIVHDPNFSFYDFTQYDYTNFREPVIAIARYGYTGQGLNNNQVYWSRVRQVINDSTAIFDTTHRPNQRVDVNSKCIFNTSSNLLKADVGGYFLNEFAPGDSIFLKDVFRTFIGKVQTVVSNDSIYLVSNALVNGASVACQRYITTLILPDNYYGPVYRLGPVLWNTDTATIYTSRAVDRYSAFHTTYLSGNVGVDFRNSSFQALGNGRNVQSTCTVYPKCYSCLNGEPATAALLRLNNNLQDLYDLNWFKAAVELKIIVFGTINGYQIGSSYEFLPAAPQKY